MEYIYACVEVINGEPQVTLIGSYNGCRIEAIDKLLGCDNITLQAVKNFWNTNHYYDAENKHTISVVDIELRERD